MTHNFYLAPLRGITDTVFRSVYEKHFGRFDRMLAPFVPTVRGKRVRDYHIRDVLPDDGVNDPERLIPQIIGNDADGFLLLSHKFADLGFSSVNWNLGCPAPLIVRKQRGAGLLPHKDIIKRFLDGVMAKMPIPLSVKTRLGLDNNYDLEKLIPIFNDYTLKELIIHPRTGSQLYEGTIDIGKFEECLKISRHVTVYNGDITTVDDFRRLSGRFPNINNWMIGRGIVRNPHLLRELRGEPAPSAEPYDGIRAFLLDLLEACGDHPRPVKALGRMKEIWRYLDAGLSDSGALSERVIRCESIAEYRKIITR